MPSAFIYLDPNDKKRKDLKGKDERDARRKEYEDNYKYHEGKQTRWLIRDIDDPVDDNITINVTKQAIDRTLSFLFPDLPVFQISPDQESTDDERWLNSAWIVNGGAYFLSLVAQNGALSGHNYVKVIQNKDGTGFPKLIAVNPTIPITYWRADDPTEVVWHELLWKAGKQEMLQDYVKGLDESRNPIWTIYEYMREDNRGAWSLSKTIVWNSMIPPLIQWAHLPNPNQFYGKAEVTENSKMLNDSINRVASDIGKILRYHASPRTIGTGLSKESVVPTEINGFFVVEDKDAKIFNLEMSSDLASSMNFLTFLNDTFLAQARVVIMKGTVKDFQRVTNTGIRAVFLDMIAKNELLRWSYGIGLQHISQAILFLGGKDSSLLPTIVWSDPLPADELETVNKLAIEQKSGWVDPQTVSRFLGWEWKTVNQNWKSLVKDEDWQMILGLSSGSADGTSLARAGKTNTNKVAV